MMHGCLTTMYYKIKCIGCRSLYHYIQTLRLQELSDTEKNLLTQIFRLFTQSDVDGSYIDRYMRIFKKPEARMMMASFANMESIHQHAYSLLLDTVGMPEIEYKAFAE